MQPLTLLQAALDDLRAGRGGVADLCSTGRSQAELLTALPVRYADVLGQLLDRLEASALFTEESCSFSQRDLLDALQTWIDRTEAALQRTV